MQLSNVSLEDGRKCAQLLNILKSGRWDLDGKNIEVYTDTLKWVQSLAIDMAGHLKQIPTTPVPISSTSPTMRIKSAGSLDGSKSKKLGKKK